MRMMLKFGYTLKIRKYCIQLVDAASNVVGIIIKKGYSNMSQKELCQVMTDVENEINLCESKEEAESRIADYCMM